MGHSPSTEARSAPRPVVLNCVLTLKCNMQCPYCVARDMRAYARESDGNLSISDSLLARINASPFTAVVITGGEPLLPECESRLLRLVHGLQDKTITVDTNGTIEPSQRIRDSLREYDVLVRVSLDSLRIEDEQHLRRTAGAFSATLEAYKLKLRLIPFLHDNGVRVSVQSVLHGFNRQSIFDLPAQLQQWSLEDWYVQRLIPATAIRHDPTAFLSNDEYDHLFTDLAALSARYGIRCITKRDRRHNCVFLLIEDGELYTQGEPTQWKVHLGHLGDELDYFAHVSALDHCARYHDLRIFPPHPAYKPL